MMAINMNTGEPRAAPQPLPPEQSNGKKSTSKATMRQPSERMRRIEALQATAQRLRKEADQLRAALGKLDPEQRTLLEKHILGLKRDYLAMEEKAQQIELKMAVKLA